MKKFVLAITVITMLMMDLSAQEYKILTSIESIVPMGIGRSRIINYAQEMDASRFTTERTQGTDSNQKEVKRKDLKIDELEETKLLNFYSATGINFQNIASNDAVISSKLTELAQQGWELVFVTSGVESDGGETDGNGIFITRYIFKR